MSLKTLGEFSGDSNAFETRFDALRNAKGSSREASPPVEELMAWLRTCVAHGRYLPVMSPEREALQGLVDYWTTRVLRLGQALPDDIERLADFDATAGIALTVECPYPGLDPYTDKQRGSFFGREALVSSYIAHLEDPTKRILLIIGASGSGKSSLVLAGVLPKLQESHRGEWLFAPRFTPGDHPLASLAAAVAQAIGEPTRASEIDGRLRGDPFAAPAEFAALCQGKPLLLLVDQFEELFTLCRDADEQKAFGDALCALSEPDGVGRQPGYSRILLTLRTDHLARFESSDSLRELHMRLLGQGNESYLSAIGFLEIKRAIAEPAKRVGLRFCPTSLIDQLASQTAGLANGLPLLQFALRRLWDTRPTENGEPLDLITEQSVRALPDVQRALGTVADGIFQGFTPAQQRICERLLQELVVLDENFEEPLRRRRNEAELSGVLQTRLPATAADVAAVIERFVDAGLLRRFGEGSQRQIEVAHEALLRHWEHINRLVTGERVKEQLHLVKQVGREAAEWFSRGKPEGYLNLRAARLERALEYAKDGWLAEAESTEYVEACAAREQAEKVKEAQAHEARLRAVEAEKAAEKAGLEKAEAEKREAEAREREATVRAKQKTVQLWLATAFGLLLLGGLLAWNKISDQRRDLESNLNAFSTLAARLPPWEGLDVAFSLAQRGDPDGRLPLAHALERMDDTWLLGPERNTDLVPNQDGSALLQFDRTPGRESLRVYTIANGNTPGSVFITLALPNRADLLADAARVGPPIDGNGNDRLAVLVFHDESANDYVVEAHHLQIGKPAASEPDVVAEFKLRNVQALSGIGFDAQGRYAVFTTTDYDNSGSNIYQVGLNSSGLPQISQLVDPAGPDASPASAVAFGQGGTDAESILITGRRDGSVYCGPKKLDPKDLATVSESGRLRQPSGTVRQVIGLARSDVFALVDSAGAVYAWGCTDAARWSPTRVDGKVSEVTLTRLSKDLGGTPLLAFLDDNHPRCYTFADKQWSFFRCNAVHQVSASVPLPDGKHLTVELNQIAAVQIYPIEMLGRRQQSFQARHAGSTVVRWEPSGSASRQSSEKKALGPTLETDDRPGKDVPWRRVKGNEWVAENSNGLVVFAALSRDGNYLAWMEQPPDRGQIVARAWKIGTATTLLLPGQSSQAVSVAIANDGTLAHGQAPESGPVEIHVNGMRIDVLDARDRTACLAFSPTGKWLVVGTVPGGRVRTYTITHAPTTGIAAADATGPWEKPFDETTNQRPRMITACDASDDGAVVIGTNEGWVKLRRPHAPWLDLTERATFRLAAPVRDVAIDRAGSHVLALTEWQLSDCSRPGLPGQALRVWDVTASNRSWRTPLSNVCLPNQAVVGVSELVDGEHGEPGVMLVTARGTRWHGCPGCARSGESPEAMLARLIESAKKAGAQSLTDDALTNRYGLKF